MDETTALDGVLQQARAAQVSSLSSPGKAVLSREMSRFQWTEPVVWNEITPRQRNCL